MGKIVILSEYTQPYDKSMVDITIKSIKDTKKTEFGDIIVLESGKPVTYTDALTINAAGLSFKDSILRVLKNNEDDKVYFFVDAGYKFGNGWFGKSLGKITSNKDSNMINNDGIIILRDVIEALEEAEFSSWDDLSKCEAINHRTYQKAPTKKYENYAKQTPVLNNKPIKATFNEYFDEVYCINLSRDQERWENMEKIFFALNIHAKRWTATTDSIFRGYSFLLADDNMNSRYLACLNSHISAMEDALARGYEKIFIIEDDVVPVKKFHERFNQFINDAPPFWDLLYLSYIRTNDDKSMWTYENLELQKITDNVVTADNFWSGMGYGISRNMMERVVNWYRSNPPIEIDRFYVEKIQKSDMFFTYGAFPQLLAGVDNYSNNTRLDEKIFDRSINSSYQRKSDYLFPEDVIDRIDPNEYFDKIFCINLLSSTERWDKAVARFKEVNLDVKRFNAITSEDPRVKEMWERIKDKTAPFRDPNANDKTLAAYHSHMDLIKHCIDNNYDRVLILEDDVVIRKDFHFLFSKSAKHKQDRAEVWMLGAFQHDWQHTIEINKHFYESADSLGLFAYALDRESMRKLYNYLQEVVEENWSIDLAIRQHVMFPGKMVFHISWPFLVGHDTVESNTRDGVYDFTEHFPRDEFNY